MKDNKNKLLQRFFKLSSKENSLHYMEQKTGWLEKSFLITPKRLTKAAYLKLLKR